MKEFLLNGPVQISNEDILLIYRELFFGDGACFKLTKGYAPKGVFLEGKADLAEHQTVFNFCLQGSQHFTLTGNYLPTDADPKKANHLLLPREKLTTQTEAFGEFSTVMLFIPLQKYLSILGDNMELLPKNYQIAAERQNLCYFKNHDWQPRIRQILVHMMTGQFSPLAGRIYLESKMLEIIAIMLEMESRISQSRQYIPKKDEEKIRYAKEILESDLANPPSLGHLARMAGTNEFTLKKGFKLLFGAPVFRFLQQQRMLKAAELLRDTHQQVSEVALAVGYENVSAFTRAFRQEQGILPSKLRKTPLLHN